MTCEEMECSNEDDEIVYEIDVFISKKLAENLCLFHHPTKPVSAPADCTECLSARIKPKQQKLELEFALDIHSQSYDKSKGEQMAINVDGLNPTGDAFFRSSVMDKYMLSGTKAGSSPDNYALGYMRKGELHITPFHSVMELRPCFKYMDKMDNLSKKNLTAEEEEDNEEAVPVTVRFEGPNAERDKQTRQKSYQYLQQQNATEPWMNINYHPYGSYLSKQEYEELICSSSSKDTPIVAISSEDYIKQLVPECLRLTGYKPIQDEETAVLEGRALSEQIRHLLMNAYVLPFSTLLKKVRQDYSDGSVERLVQQDAVLVQGCWVIKSDLLYVQDSFSSLTGFSGKNLIIVRDYVMWLFTQSRTITRLEILALIKVPPQDLDSIITQIAIRCDRGWEFKYPYDAEFIESNPNIVKSQELKWDYRYKNLLKELKDTGLQKLDPSGQSQKPPGPTLPRAKQKRLSRSSISEEGEESGNDSSTSGLRESKTKRMYSPKKRAPSSPSKLTAKSNPFPIATLDVSPTILETMPTDEVKGDLKEYIEEMIRTHFIMTLSELKEAVNDSHLSALCSRSDFVDLLDEAISTCGAQKLKNKWPQNTTPEPLYAFTEFGNKLDRYRNILLELFTTTARTRTNFFAKIVEEELREIISDNDCRQIFEDYCVHKSGFYYLKGTISLDS